ncbi:hypothetical protein D3C81_1223880 [compost metagenome]
MWALAHDQPYQQRLRRLLQGAEIQDEIALVVLQQRFMPFLDPVEGGQEVAQVIEVGDWRKWHHGKGTVSLYSASMTIGAGDGKCGLTGVCPEWRWPCRECR